ncbi:nucleic acid/nucleotide deaminase domain-containing protein [Streptomyces californicus]|uniref:nucleic acid/nucleotide deaminase domain-containing protein n=1 Tax=Streptomyces californicus TaxID=67351 RepID=UPI0034D96D92
MSFVSVPVPDPCVAHFGSGGLRRFSAAEIRGCRLQGASAAALAEVGVPVHVTPYFRAARPTDSAALGVFAAHGGAAAPSAEKEGWLRLGSDGLAHLCVRPDEAVQAVFLGGGEEDMFVNQSVSAFNAALTALDRQLPVIAAAPDLATAAAAFRELNSEVRQLDDEAFAQRESWWPRVLDDVRHTLNFPFSAAFEYIDANGAKQVATEATGPGRAHPEELVWARLEGEGITPQQVRRVYCELEPCMLPGHYCAVWMQRTFPHAEFTHSYDFGSDAESREAGLRELIIQTAQQSAAGE